MKRDAFEVFLTKVVDQLGKEVRANTAYHKPDVFQKRVFDVMKQIGKDDGLEVNPSWHPHAFPDIQANGFGVEVKATNKDSWLTVGNSVFESMRDPACAEIYVVFGKMGGMPSVKWGRYEDRIWSSAGVRAGTARRAGEARNFSWGLAQLAERLTLTQQVFSSILKTPAKFKSNICREAAKKRTQLTRGFGTRRIRSYKRRESGNVSSQ